MKILESIAMMAGAAYIAIEIESVVRYVKAVFAPLMTALGA